MTDIANSFGLLRLPGSIVFGDGTRSSIARTVATLGHRALVVCDPFLSSCEAFTQLLEELEALDVVVTVDTKVVPELPIGVVEEAIERAGLTRPQVIVGFGGGSALDLAKLIALGLAHALEATGAATAIAQALVGATTPLGPLALLTGVYVLALGTASLLTNAAAAALVFPIAITAARAAELDPRPFAITVALAASAAFATPVGSNAILLVHGPGGYRYRDFTRVGLPLNALCLAVVLVAVPLIWPLAPA